MSNVTQKKKTVRNSDSEYRPYLFYLAVKIIVYLPRDKDIDKPQIVFLSLIGNDVCNGRYPTEPNFTTEEEFRAKTLQTLDHLGQLLKIPRNQIMTIFRVSVVENFGLIQNRVPTTRTLIIFLKTKKKTKFYHLDLM